MNNPLKYLYLRRIVNSLFVILIVQVAIPRLYAQQSIITNDDIILQSCLSQLNKSILIDTLHQAVYPTGNLVDNHKYDVIQLLLKKNKKVSTTEKHTAILKLNIITNNAFKKLSKKYGQRLIEGTLTATIIDTGGTIEGEDRYKINYEDTLLNRQANAVTNIWNETHFVVSPKKHPVWHRVVQPALLLVSIGVTIYLLFNVRGH